MSDKVEEATAQVVSVVEPANGSAAVAGVSSENSPAAAAEGSPAPAAPAAPVLKPAPVPTQSTWKTPPRDSSVIPSISFDVENIIRKKPQPAKENRRTKRKPVAGSAGAASTANGKSKKTVEKRSNSKDDANDAAGKRKQQAHSQQHPQRQQQQAPRRSNRSRNPYLVNVQDIEIGSVVNWPSEEAKAAAVAACVAQLEYYLGINNLLKDMHLRKHMNTQGWLAMADVAQFARMKAITGGDIDVLVQASKAGSSVFECGFVGADESFDNLKLRTLTKPLNWVLAAEQRLGAGLDEAVPAQNQPE